MSSSLAGRSMHRDRLQTLRHTNKVADRPPIHPVDTTCPCCRQPVSMDAFMITVARVSALVSSRQIAWDDARRAVCGRVACKAGQLTLPMVSL